MTPAELAEMEAICFPNASVHWSENDYAAHIKNSFGVTISSDAGFVVGRVTADEAEIINLGVLPDCRQEGHGTDLLAQFEKEVLASGAEMILLEVSADNKAALALYKTRDFTRVGRRRKYYENAQGIATDAFILKKLL